MNENNPKNKSRRWLGPLLCLLIACVVVLSGMLATSILERRWETARPALVLKPIADFEPDNAVWGQNYPLEYESYLKTKQSDSKTLYGGAIQRDYLNDDPNLVILWTGYGFRRDYKQARGHYHSVEDVLATQRSQPPTTMGTCFTCKSTDVPRLMNQWGVDKFYHTPFADLKPEVKHPIGCQDCHDPKTMNLRISRPAFREALLARGEDVEQLGHQEMRSAVCAQCHVEYYFRDKYYLTFPWKKGRTVEDIIATYDEIGFADFIHPISKTPILKAQHPDYELWSTGVHAYRRVSCADCHMPYRTEGGVKFTDHHVQSPLLQVSESCGVCHRWSEEELRKRVEEIQTKVAKFKNRVEKSLVLAHFDVAAAMEAQVPEEKLQEARTFIRHAQFRWDFISSNNGMGFHSPQESLRVLGIALDEASLARLRVARLMAEKGVVHEPSYPDISTFGLATQVAETFESGKPIPLLPARGVVGKP